MDPGKLLLEFVLVIWLVVVWRGVRQPVQQPRVLLVMTAGAAVTNVALTYLGIIQSPTIAPARARIGDAALHGLLAFGVVKWTVFVYLITRVALMVAPHVEGAGFALLSGAGALRRSAAAGLVLGLGACAIIVVASRIYVAAGVLEYGVWDAAKQAGIGWEIGVLGGLRNLFGEEVITRLGVQTLLLYHLREKRWGPIVALVTSSLYFEIWHSSLTDFYFINFATSCLFAWGYRRWGYEAAAVAHLIADWLAIALPLYLLAQ